MSGGQDLVGNFMRSSFIAMISLIQLVRVNELLECECITTQIERHAATSPAE
jgi:hypothetical protein